MNHPLSNILGSPDTFLDQLFDQVDIDVSDYYMDHICYRVATFKAYELLKFELLAHGELLSDNMIGGRPITVIELDESYQYQNREFSVIELPAPKEGRPYADGYEHVEFVINEKLEDFIHRHPNATFDIKGLQKPLNRDVRLSLEGCSVKFHEHSLKEVIQLEQS